MSLGLYFSCMAGRGREPGIDGKRTGNYTCQPQRLLPGIWLAAFFLQHHDQGQR